MNITHVVKTSQVINLYSTISVPERTQTDKQTNKQLSKQSDLLTSTV